MFSNSAPPVKSDISLVPRPSTAAADGLHHRYAERGSGEIAYFFVTSGRSLIKFTHTPVTRCGLQCGDVTAFLT